MNRIILSESEYLGDFCYALDSRKSNHILKTLKSKVGDELKAGLINSSIGTAVVKSIDSDKREVIVTYNLEKSQLPKSSLSKIRVFSSIQRPQTVKKIIHLAANCGISELFFFPAEKSEFSYLNSSIWSENNLLEEIILGLEQGGRIYSPKILVLKNKYKIKENLLTANRIILDLGTKSLLDLESRIDFFSPIEIVLGPESGLTQSDLEFFTDLGFQKISISENILRSEVALAFVLSQIELLKNRPS